MFKLEIPTMITKRFSLIASILFAASLAIGGCASANSGIEADENVASNSEAAAVADADDKHEKHGMHGHPLLAAALKEIDLSAEQRKTIEAAVENTRTGNHDQMKAFQKALADDIRAGKVDEATVKAKSAGMEKAHTEHRAAVVKAVETLHATLTPAQRTQLVTSVKERMQKHAEKGGKHEHGKKHDKGGPDGEKHARHGGRGGHGPMMFMLHGIDLRDDQKQAIEAAMPPKPEKDADDRAAKFEEHRAQMDAALEAFKADKFDAATVLPERDGKHPMADRFVKMLQVVVPILDADQRAELAKRVEEGPRMGKHGKHGKHGPRHGDNTAE
jgi:Spy/CpxP family protein refolding chaperone